MMLSEDRPLAPHRKLRRIGLISPYSGGNLGNTAILTSMILNIHKRLVDVEVLGITLGPDETRRRLGIQAFPLAGVSRPYYTLSSSGSSPAGQRQSPVSHRIRQWLKKIHLLRSCVRTIRVWYLELAHIAAASRVARSLDCAIIAGGGPLDESWGGPWGHPWSLFKWSVLSRVNGVPLLFISVGKSSLERPLSRFFVRNALRLAQYRSYRDNGSKIAVQTLMDASNDPVYPDLAFSYSFPAVQSAHRNCSENGQFVVGISPIAYCDPRVWPFKNEQRYSVYVSKLAEMVKWLLKQRHQILFFTTDSPDAASVEDIQALISSSSIDAEAIQTLPCSTEQSVDSFLKNISRVDLTIASRLHGVILSHLNTTPVLALSFDPKVDAHMNAVGHKNYCLSINHLQLETIIERFTTLKSARQREQAHLRSATLRFRHLLDLQYDRILGASQSSLVTGNYHNQIDASPLSEIG